MINLSLNAFLLIAAVSQPFLPVDASANTRFSHETIVSSTGESALNVSSLSSEPENYGDDYSTEDKVNMINLTVLGLELAAGAVTWWNESRSSSRASIIANWSTPASTTCRRWSLRIYYRTRNENNNQDRSP